MQLGVPDVLNERFTSRCTGKHRCNERTTQTHLLKLNGRVPRMSLGSSFQRDLLHTAAKKGEGTQITQVFIPGRTSDK